MKLVIVGTLLAWVGAGAAAFAANGSPQEQAACRPDVRRLCGKIGRGDENKYRDCLQTHFSDLSQKCRQVLMKHQNQH